jgi:hypothetical protein
MNLPESLKRLHPVFYGKPDSPPVFKNRPASHRDVCCTKPTASLIRPDRRRPQTGLPPDTRFISDQL